MKSLTATLVRSALLLVTCVGLAQNSPAQSLSDLLAQLKSSSKTSGDATLASLGGELGTNVTSLNKSLAGNPEGRKQVQGALQSLLSGNGAGSLGSLSKLTEAKLTPEQTKLAKDVSNVGGAYLVQKNFGALEGSQTEVAQIVGALRQGNPVSALPALHKVAQNAKLTPAQKELAGALADKYAPGARKLGNALGDGLKSIPGLGQ